MRLRTENLTVSYGAQTVLDGLSLALPAGKITALLGPNGCGKSTLLNCFSRLLTPDSGEILLDEKPIAGFPPASWLAAWLYCRNTIYPPRGSLYGNWFPTAAARGCRCGGDSPRKTTSGSTWQ
ncbi:Iron(III) dicitrate transport ATP-binding protein FecE (TC 3.A.1.14.1) [Klebsiella pneumoniae IS33]|jgi:ABC-type multidrug transport system ATPase subunit|nr:Iron(III) dicitrate transport ATP-binding protein FecE (TC 3.A.1.14.1) [Klebsiella pneumoniae IS33]CDL53293.1 Iron(III) dicitrate transport ATP-binding protein FecE (TC 3.A.1.14.1) [Klebsiella pneumoniae ISC21]